jgi:hypothetical protein
VEVFRLDSEEEKRASGDDKPKAQGPRIGQWLITATGAEQGQEFAARLADVVFQDETHFGMGSKCFFPGVAFRVWHEHDSVDVIVCFAWENLSMTTRRADGHIDYSGFSEFGGSKQSVARLVRLAKEAFPEDQAIQKLVEAGGTE